MEKKAPKPVGKLYIAKHDSEEDCESELGSPRSSSEEGRALITREVPKELPECSCCKAGKHRIHNCRKFFLMFNLRERIQFVKNGKLCSPVAQTTK